MYENIRVPPPGPPPPLGARAQDLSSYFLLFVLVSRPSFTSPTTSGAQGDSDEERFTYRKGAGRSSVYHAGGEQEGTSAGSVRRGCKEGAR